MLESFLASVAALASIFGWAFFHFWSAIPAGIALGLSPVLVCMTVIASYGCGVALVILVGEPVRRRIQQRARLHPDTEAEEQAQPASNRMIGLILRAWDRFGLVGLAVLAPMTVGAQVGAVIGLGFGARPWPLLAAMTLGAGLWAGAITLAAVTGAMALTGPPA